MTTPPSSRASTAGPAPRRPRPGARRRGVTSLGRQERQRLRGGVSLCYASPVILLLLGCYEWRRCPRRLLIWFVEPWQGQLPGFCYFWPCITPSMSSSTIFSKRSPAFGKLRSQASRSACANSHLPPTLRTGSGCLASPDDEGPWLYVTLPSSCLHKTAPQSHHNAS
jgi:hypothetical protein